MVLSLNLAGLCLVSFLGLSPPCTPGSGGCLGGPCLGLQRFLGWLRYLQDHVCAFQACWHMFWDGDVAGQGRVSPVCRRTADSCRCHHVCCRRTCGVWGHSDLVSKLFPRFFLIPERGWSLLLPLPAAFLGSAWGCSRTSGHHTLPPVRICSPSAHPGHLLHPQLHPQPFPGVKTAAQSKRMLQGLPGTWGQSLHVPPPAELLNPISKLYLPIERPVGIAELGNGWNSSSFPARGFSTGQRDGFGGCSLPNTAVPWGILSMDAQDRSQPLAKPPSRGAGVLRSSSKQELTGIAGNGRKTTRR